MSKSRKTRRKSSREKKPPAEDLQQGQIVPLRWLLYILILLSGAAGLVYEVVWARQLTLFIGNTAVANAAVLTAFMTGLAAGSLVLGRKADKITKPLLLYALLEVLIGLYGATTPWLFNILQAGYADFAGVVGVTGAYSHLPRFLIAILAMLVPTFLMGGTLPLLVKYFTRQITRAQYTTARIYGINTLGATAGAFLAGFYLLPAMGITSTLLVAAAINIIVGLGVYLLLKHTALRQYQTPAETAGDIQTGSEVKLQRPSMLLIGFALSGFAALLYQVVWIHALILIIGVSVYAFSTVLTVFLSGIGLGSLLVGHWVRNTGIHKLLKIAFVLQLGVAISAAASLGLISQLPILFVQGWETLHDNFMVFQAYMFLLTAAVIFIPTLLLGALFPLITGVWSQSAGAVGRGVGDAYAANALGTIAGSAIGGLFILDWLGIEGSLHLASGVSILVAALFWYMASEGQLLWRRGMALPLSALLLVIAVMVLPGWDRTIMQAQVFRYAKSYVSSDVRSEIDKYMSDAEFLYYREGIHGTISVISRDRGKGYIHKVLLNNGRADASNSGDMDTQILMGQLPLFLHDNPKDALVIGLGSGMTAGATLQNRSIEHLDIIEISPEVVEASHYFSRENYHVLDDPRANMIIADGRNYLLASDKKYDVIVSEPSHSWVTGVSNLFTREFMQQARDGLKDGGILVQWFQLYGMDKNSLRSLLKSVSDVFPFYTLWAPQGGDIIIVSSNEPLQIEYNKLLSVFSTPEIKKSLASIHIHSVEGLLDQMLVPSTFVNPLLSDQEANTDVNPVVEFTAPKYLYQATSGDNLKMLLSGLKNHEFQLPFTGLHEKYKDWSIVPFLGIGFRHDNEPHTIPVWSQTRWMEHDEKAERYSVGRGTKSIILLRKAHGDMHIRANIGKSTQTDSQLLPALLKYGVADDETSFRGKLKGGAKEIYWRVAPSPREGMMKVAVAMTCKKDAGLSSWVMLSGPYPGDVNEQSDTVQAVQEVNKMIRCLNN